MKTWLIVSALALTSVSALAQTPTNSEFDSVAEISQKLGYTGYDVMICKNDQNRMVVGGLMFWSTPLQIFLVEPNGNVVKTNRLTKEDLEQGENHYQTVPEGKNVLLQLGHSRADDGLIVGQASLSFPPQEIAVVLTCYLRNSGLE